MNLSENLKKIRKDNNLSQEDLAEKLNVSRQSVSKWESGVAYPEMDKVLELCKLFDLNIDELLNQDIKEVEKTKQSKNNINKYIDSFLSYISKSVNLFSSLKFKNKIKCLLEQLFLAIVLFIISALLGELLQNVVESILGFLPDNIYYRLNRIFDGVYVLFAFLASISIMLHIFKVRYLDYYTIVDKETNSDIEENTNGNKELKKEDSKKIERKEEKIIIRDPEHSGYKFINGLIKVILFFIKCFMALIGLGFACSLIGFVICFVLVFLISQSGILFIGSLIGLLGSIIINLIILDIIISFIINRKVKKGFLLLTFLISLIVVGVSLGLVLISYKDFSIIKEYNENYYVREELTYKMNNNLRISDYNIEYIESKNNDIKIVYDYPNYCKLNSYYSIDSNVIYHYTDCLGNPELFKNFLKNLNDKVIIDDNIYIKVYTSKENIKLLKNNDSKYYKNLNE